VKAAVAGLFLAAALIAEAQERSTPVFPAEARLVAIDVNALDGEGRPVPDLAADEFAVTVDGSPRRVVYARFTDSSGSGEAAAVPATPEFSTNVGAAPGRAVVIAVDEGSLPFGVGRTVIRSAESLIEPLRPRDQVALVTMPGGGPQVDLTTDHARVLAALKQVHGRAFLVGVRRLTVTEALYFDERREEWGEVVRRLCPNPGDQTCKSDLEAEAFHLAVTFHQESQVAIKSIGLLMDSLQAVEGPKTVVLITRALHSEDAGELRDIATKAAQARVAFYAVLIDESLPDASMADAVGLSLEDAGLASRDLYRLAGLTRGQVFRSSGSAGPYERIAREIGGFYLVGFEAEARDTDGKNHTIRVQVRRRGITVRERRELPLVPTPSSQPRPAREELAELVRSPRVATDLPLHVATYALRDPHAPQKIRLLVSALVGDESGAGTSVGFAVVRADGRVVGQSSQEIPKPKDPVAGAAPYLAAVSVDPGEYTLRLAAVDGRGRAGSVQHPVRASLLSAGGVSIGALVLVPVGERASVAVSPLATDRIDGPALGAYVEIYGPAPVLASAVVRLDLDAEGQGAPATVAKMALDPTGSVLTGRAVLAIGGLSPGPHVARATILVGGKAVGEVTRSFRIATPAAP
jgi:VWFA-related protein